MYPWTLLVIWIAYMHFSAIHEQVVVDCLVFFGFIHEQSCQLQCLGGAIKVNTISTEQTLNNL